MTYTYRANVTMGATLEIKAESYDVAEELVEQFLALVSDDGRVSITSFDGMDAHIDSDDDPEDGWQSV